MQRIITAVVVGIVVTQGFIEAELALDLGSWHANAPVADVLALLLIPFALVEVLRGRTEVVKQAPGLAAYVGFLGVALVSAVTTESSGAAVHEWLRKHLFVYVAYGVCLSWAATQIPRPWIERGIKTFLLITAGISIITSIYRWMDGNSLWFTALGGITPNHKTLALVLAAWVPWLFRPQPQRVLLTLVLVAVGLSASKAAIITGLFGLAWAWPKNRPLITRPRITLTMLALAFGMALSAPVLIGSRTMLDAARSRHSLNVRAWQMYEHRPWVGMGPGANTRVEMVTFPHYRVNGVDAHGVVQKVASETGVLGLLAYGWFVVAWVTRLWTRSKTPWWQRPEVGVMACLHLNLFLSTETFSSTHWIPFGLMWGISERNSDAS